MTIRSGIGSGLLLCAGLFFAGSNAGAQKTTASPPTDSAEQASPVQAAPKVPPVDAAAQASPIPEPQASDVWLSPKTALPVALDEAIDSGKLHNGQTIHARLTTAVTAHAKMLPAGTPVAITIVATVPAGKLNAVGEFSLQVLNIGGVGVYTDTQTFRGKPGPRLTADAAPQVGTDAILSRDTHLIFSVLPPPQPATGPPANIPNPPGSVSNKQ